MAKDREEIGNKVKEDNYKKLLLFLEKVEKDKKEKKDDKKTT